MSDRANARGAITTRRGDKGQTRLPYGKHSAHHQTPPRTHLPHALSPSSHHSAPHVVRSNDHRARRRLASRPALAPRARKLFPAHGSGLLRRRVLSQPLAPLAALGLSDLYVNYHYATEYDFFEMPWSSVALRMLCFVAAIGIGCLIARRKSWGTLFGGAFAASLLFYLVTNTAAWAEDGFYAKTLAGWWQALTVGHPEYPSTLSFFRNSLLSDLSFTALFAVALEYAALRTGQHTLLTPPAPKAEPVAG